MNGFGIALASLAVIAAVYELVAVALGRSSRLPTITRIIHAGRLPARLAAILVGCLVMIDHFGTHILLVVT